MIAGYIGIGMAVALAGATLYAVDADRALARETKKAVAAELRADAFAKGLTQCRTEIAERNKFVNDAMNLPEIRKRLCAQRSPEDACCKAAPKPPEVDGCKP
jgi:hypothetical protein